VRGEWGFEQPQEIIHALVNFDEEQSSFMHDISARVRIVAATRIFGAAELFSDAGTRAGAASASSSDGV